MRRRMGCALAVALALAIAARLGASSTLDIYFIDVEGGQSTLVVTPAGESLLIDTGYAGFNGRDADRVMLAAKAAGISRIDYLLLTHFHGDHAGGIPELAKRLPIGAFVDHDSILPNDTLSKTPFDAYVKVRAGGRHIVAKAGDRLPLKGLDVDIVSSGGGTIAAPLPGAGQKNSLCKDTAPDAAEPIENPRSTGVRIRFGSFRFIDVGDLSGKPLFALVCPNNLLGQADVYLVPHHGGDDVVYPATFAVKPRVAIVNNSEVKGGAAEAFTALHHEPGVDVWQLHKSRAAGPQNYPDDRIANLDATTAHWIKVSASEDGSFTVSNGRTGQTKRY